MFSRMKPLPKVLILGALVAGIVFGVSKLMPEKSEAPTPQAQQMKPEVVAPAPEHPAVKAAEERLNAKRNAEDAVRDAKAAAAPVYAPAAKEEPAAEPDAGMAALLNKGKK